MGFKNGVGRGKISFCFFTFLVIFDFGVWNMAVWSEDLVRGKFQWYIACLITSLFVVFYFLKWEWELPKAYLKPKASHIIFLKDLFCRDKIMTRCVVSSCKKNENKENYFMKVSV